jgi:prepilin-type N-terminal cleavage/methylation domain-containing protein
MTESPKKTKRASGFTLIEMAVVISLAALMTLGVGIFLADGQRGWNRLFSRVYGETAVDGFAAHKVFDSVCRKASSRKHVIGAGGDTLEVYYWDTGSTASTPEQYARFYLEGDELYVQHGALQSGTWQPGSPSGSPVKIAGGIESVTFDARGTSLQMFLTYTDEETMPIVCSTVRHNK